MADLVPKGFPIEPGETPGWAYVLIAGFLVFVFIFVEETRART